MSEGEVRDREGNGGNIAYHAQGLVGQALVPKS